MNDKTKLHDEEDEDSEFLKDEDLQELDFGDYDREYEPEAWDDMPYDPEDGDEERDEEFEPLVGDE